MDKTQSVRHEPSTCQIAEPAMQEGGKMRSDPKLEGSVQKPARQSVLFHVPRARAVGEGEIETVRNRNSAHHAFWEFSRFALLK